jgi:hypothetical protein
LIVENDVVVPLVMTGAMLFVRPFHHMVICSHPLVMTGGRKLLSMPFVRPFYHMAICSHPLVMTGGRKLGSIYLFL